MHIGIDTGSGKWSESYYDLLERGTADVLLRRGAGRRAARALARPVARAGAERPLPRLRVVVGVDVRVPDAGAVSAAGARLAAVGERKVLPVRAAAARAPGAGVGRVGERVLRARQRAELPLQGARLRGAGPAAGHGQELVLSPYSSFLALAVEPRAAMRNLRRLAALGLLGQHGFFDALDCTRARTGGGGQIVRCVMAHHQGMSLLAACNALCGDQVRRWFFADPAMRAHATLLSERLPLGAPALRRRAEQPAERRAAAPCRTMRPRARASTPKPCAARCSPTARTASPYRRPGRASRAGTR